MDRGLNIRFAQRAYLKGIIDHKSRVSPGIEFLMLKFIKGNLDSAIWKKNLKKVPRNEIISAHVNKSIKEAFGDKAWEDKIINHPSSAIILIEYLMRKFINGKLDSFLFLEGK